MSADPVLGSSQIKGLENVYGNPRLGQSFVTFGKSKTVPIGGSAHVFSDDHQMSVAGERR